MTIAAPKLSYVRQFKEDDIPQVADVHRRVFHLAGHTSPELLDSYRAWFTQVFLNNPWRNEAVGSLVYQDEAGRITGFLGVMPQRMAWNGHPVQVAIMSNFVVDTDARGMAGMKLLGAFLAGPQDLAIADEANPDVRRIWEGLGGATSLPYSMHWYYPLRPFQFAAFIAREKKLIPGFLYRACSPAGRILDTITARVLKFPFRRSESRLSGQDLDTETLAACLSEATRKQTLRPDYDLRSLTWILQRAQQMRTNGRLQKVVLRTDKQDVAGWYLYYANPSGVSQVVQLHAKPPHTNDVLDHLFNHAWRQGATVLSGRPEPGVMQALAERNCIFRCGPEWALIHSRKPDLVNAFHRNDVYFSRLEGEWCTHFR
jgi:hypothetical protein